MDKVFIKDLRTRGIIGIYDHEREIPQEICINVELFADLRKAGETDDIADCVNYHSLAKQIRAHAETAGRLTVEALAADIAALALREPAVQRVRVRVEKPEAVGFAHSVGVEIERTRG